MPLANCPAMDSPARAVVMELICPAMQHLARQCHLGSVHLASAALTAGAVLARLPARRFRSTIAGPPTPNRWRSSGSEPERRRDLFWGVGGKRLAPDPGAIHRHRDQARRIQPRLHRASTRRSANGARSSHPRRRPRSSPRGSIWGHRLSPAADLLLAEWTGGESDLPEPAAAGAVPREDSRTSTASTPATWSYYRNPFVGTPPDERPAGPAGDARQLGSQGRPERRSTPSRSRSKGRGAGTSRATWARRSAAPASSMPRAATSRSSRRRRSSAASRTGSCSSTTAAATRRCSSTSVPPTCAGCASALDALTDRQMAGRLPRRRLSASPRRPVHPPHEAENRRRPAR